MGGMNAGEVASQLVVDTIAREMKLFEGQTLNTPEQVSAMARRAIVDADSAIKQYVAAHPEVSGTGSTVVLLWLLGDKAVVAWCGDSRCYRYNPRRGLEQLSHDHSYVQQLVDEGKLPPEMAFGHEHSNIITRCLSDDKEVAEPDVKVVDVYRDDLFLLCTDGLCGLLPDDVTEQLLRDSSGDAAKALASCWQRGTVEGWNDNVSIILAAVDGVEAEAPERKVAPLPKRPSYTTVEVEVEPASNFQPSTFNLQPSTDAPTSHRGSGHRRWLLWAVLLLLLVAAGVFLWFRFSGGVSPEKPTPRPAASRPEGRAKPRHESVSVGPFMSHEQKQEPAAPQPASVTTPSNSGDNSAPSLMQASDAENNRK